MLSCCHAAAGMRCCCSCDVYVIYIYIHEWLEQDEVRSLGMALGMDEFSVWRHPFPGPGLAIRCLAPLSEENLSMAREVRLVVSGGGKCGRW